MLVQLLSRQLSQLRLGVRPNLLGNVLSKPQTSALPQVPVLGGVRFKNNKTEGPLFRVEGNFKTFKPTSSGLRFRRYPLRDHLHKGKPIRKLTIAKRKTGGRNDTGRITCRHRGGGHKQRIRLVDFQRLDTGAFEVVRLEYDPLRSAHLALLKHIESEKLVYIVAPQDLNPGMVVESFRVAREKTAEEKAEEERLGEVTRTVPINVGNCMPLRMVPVGTIVHCVSLKADGLACMVRSAGTWAQVVSTGATGFASIRLASGETRKVPVDAFCTIGKVSNPDHQHRVLGKAGAKRRLGWRPSVRGMAMNPCDHPHGGGRGKSKGNRQPVSPWGVLAKGGKTRKHKNKMVVHPRPRR